MKVGLYLLGAIVSLSMCTAFSAQAPQGNGQAPSQQPVASSPYETSAPSTPSVPLASTDLPSFPKSKQPSLNEQAFAKVRLITREE